MPQIKSKRTKYKNIVFRSKLEAQWAVFFDFLNIAYQYEPDWDYVEFGGFQIPYKPDFYLTEFDLWIEIKPVELKKISDGDIRKIVGWANDEVTEIIVLIGAPKIPKPLDKEHHKFQLSPKKEVIKISSYWWCICPKCGKVGIEWMGSIPNECQDSCFKEDEFDLFGEEIDYPDGHKTKRLKDACAFARRYQF